MKNTFHLAILLGLWFAAPAAPAANPQIVAAENFYGSVAREITGSGVFSILSNPNQDPHEFTTNASTAKAVADADVVIYSGIGYDTWIERLLSTSGKPDRVVIDVADLIGAKDGDNPHIWYDPRTMPAFAAKLVEVLSKLNPEQADIYEKRLNAFNGSMQPVLARIADIKKAAAGLEVTATEPVFGYMAAALGFKMLNYDFQVNIMNDAEPSAAQTAAFENSLITKKAKLLFYNAQVTDPTTDRIQKIARQAGVPVIGVTETEPPDEKDYVSWMLDELGKIQAVLGGKSS